MVDPTIRSRILEPQSSHSEHINFGGSYRIDAECDGATVSICQNNVRSRKPFIVREISADMLGRHPQLSKGARILWWLTMRSMADHRTGELRHRQHWYTGEEIDRRAEISTRRRKDLMKELSDAGYVQWERERVKR